MYWLDDPEFDHSIVERRMKEVQKMNESEMLATLFKINDMRGPAVQTSITIHAMSKVIAARKSSTAD